MKQETPDRQRIEAAGAVTIIFGVLTAILAAVWQFAAAMGKMPQSPASNILGLLAVASVFALLGWGVMKLKRPCAAVAGALAGVIVVGQVAGTFWGDSSAGSSLFFLLGSGFVLAGNWVAWQEMGKSAP